MKNDFMEEIIEMGKVAKQAEELGQPALCRLMRIAEENASGQAQYITRFLIGLYSSYRFPFALHHLRAIDQIVRANRYYIAKQLVVGQADGFSWFLMYSTSLSRDIMIAHFSNVM